MAVSIDGNRCFQTGREWWLQSDAFRAIKTRHDVEASGIGKVIARSVSNGTGD